MKALELLLAMDSLMFKWWSRGDCRFATCSLHELAEPAGVLMCPNPDKVKPKPVLGFYFGGAGGIRTLDLCNANAAL